MALCLWSVTTLGMLLIIASVSSEYFPNHKYNDSDVSFGIETHENELGFRNFYHRHIKPSLHYVPSQLRSPLSADISGEGIKLKTQRAERKLTLNNDPPYSTKPSDFKGKRSYENFVTPKKESSQKGYEVTTKKFQDNEPESPLTPSALGLDNDVAIALEDEEDSHEAQSESYRPEHLNPLVYLDSYGRLHGEGQSPRGYGKGFSYGVVHTKKPSRFAYSRQAPGRVRMQVFRGPTRILGHKKYAPWGYYVVQPSDNYGPHHYPGPPYIYR